MTSSYTVTTPFNPRWHDEYGTQGVWNGSDPSGPNDDYALSNWKISTGASEYRFNFSTEQGQGDLYTVFATVTDGPTTYGAKFVMHPGRGETCDLNFTPQGTLEFEAGKLISDDPKLKIGTSTNQPSSVYLKWTGTQWFYSDDAKDYHPYACGSDIEMSPDARSNDCTVYVTDETGSGHTCAVYYKDSSLGSNVGRVQSEARVTSAKQPISVTPPASSSGQPWTCTINLFATLPSTATLRASS